MEIPNPLEDEITIYSKSACINCVKVKTLLKENNIKFTIINCDEFILEDKPGFLQFIHLLVGTEYKTFPMVFLNKTFIGGYKETEDYLTKLRQKELIFDTNF
jgi:glutaredoxin